jgi:hypothetical protein
MATIPWLRYPRLPAVLKFCNPEQEAPLRLEKIVVKERITTDQTLLVEVRTLLLTLSKK